MEIKEFLDIEFVRVATFQLSDNPYVYPKMDKDPWQRPTQIVFHNERFVDSECSAYLVCEGTNYDKNSILYVGEYTQTIKHRWLRRNKANDVDEWISWHSENLDDGINKRLKDYEETKTNKEISLWLTLNPFVETPFGQLNISRSIEQYFLHSDLVLPFNKKGRKSEKNDGLKVMELVLNHHK